jgi:hypothetical protein
MLNVDECERLLGIGSIREMLQVFIVEKVFDILYGGSGGDVERELGG